MKHSVYANLRNYFCRHNELMAKQIFAAKGWLRIALGANNGCTISVYNHRCASSATKEQRFGLLPTENLVVDTFELGKEVR